jgi:hypothetical protein
MAAMTGGQTPVSISFGFASYDFTNNKWGYLGKKGNKWYENVGYGLGALANVADILAGFRPGDATLRTENNPNYKTTTRGKGYDPIGHSQLDIDGNIIIDWGPNPQVDGLLGWANGRNDWERGVLLPNYKGTKYWDPINIKGANLSTLEAYGRMLDNGGSFNLAINSCVSQTSRALNLSGIFNVGILPGINHPYWLHFQMYMRSIGIRPSIYSYWLLD